MKKKIVRILAMLLIVLLWTFFLFFQHLACIDVFGINPWYLYVLAVLSFCLQHIMLYISRKHSLFNSFFMLFGIIYIIILSYPAIEILRYQLRLAGLDVLSLCLDALNVLLVFVWHRRS